MIVSTDLRAVDFVLKEFISNTSQHFIIPHRQYNENILAKLLCPILTAAEGFVTGTAVKMFSIAGPVIVYGIAASVVYGLVCWLYTLI